MAERSRPNLNFNGLDPAIIVQALQQQQQLGLQKEKQASDKKQQQFNNIIQAANTGFSLANQAQQLADKGRKSGAVDKIVDIISQQEQQQTAQLNSFTQPQVSGEVDPTGIPAAPAFDPSQFQQGQLDGSQLQGPAQQINLQRPITQFQPPQAPTGTPQRAAVESQLGQVQQSSQLAQAQALSGDIKSALATANLNVSSGDTLSAEAAQALGVPEIAGLEEDEAKLVLESIDKKRTAAQKADETKQKIDEGKIKTATGMRKEFVNSSKAFVESRDAVERIRAIASGNPSAANDLAFIFNFMKAQDPGSVVRESEFRTAEQAKAWLAKSETLGINIPSPIATSLQKLDPSQKGAFLLPQQRQEFLKTANSAFNATKKGQKKLEREYRKLAKETGVSPTQVVIDLKDTPSTIGKKPKARPVKVGNRTFKVRRK